MSFFIANDDELCPKDVAMQYISQMPTEMSIHEFVGEDHSFFNNPAGNKGFMRKLLFELAL